MVKNLNYYFIAERLTADTALVEYGTFVAEIPKLDTWLPLSTRVEYKRETSLFFQVEEGNKTRSVTALSNDMYFHTLYDVFEWRNRNATNLHLVFGESCILQLKKEAKNGQ